jgi:hypothetical protein
MPGRHCTICIDPTRLRRAAELIAEGASDVAVAAELKVGRMAVQRHRISHILAPTQAIAAAAAKSRPAEAERNEVVARAEAGTLDPTDYLSMGPIIDGLRRTDERLERVAASAGAADPPRRGQGEAGRCGRLPYPLSRPGRRQWRIMVCIPKGQFSSSRR